MLMDNFMENRTFGGIRAENVSHIVFDKNT
jgi:hypothetical protein